MGQRMFAKEWEKTIEEIFKVTEDKKIIVLRLHPSGTWTMLFEDERRR